MIEKLWKLVAPIISGIIGILVANKFNLFNMLPFVPVEYAYEICITVYFAIADVIIDQASEFISKIIKNRFCSEIEVVLYLPNTEANISSNPIIVFNNEDLAEAGISVSVRGRKKHFKKTEIQIKNPAFADVQSNYKRNEVRTDNECYYINLEALFGSNERTSFVQNFRIILAQMPVDGVSIAKLEPLIINKRINVIYKHNYAQIKAGGR